MYLDNPNAGLKTRFNVKDSSYGPGRAPPDISPLIPRTINLTRVHPE